MKAASFFSFSGTDYPVT